MIRPTVRSFFYVGTALRSPHCIRVVHTTVGRLLIGHSFLTISNSWMTVLQTLVTKQQPPLPQFTFSSLWMNRWQDYTYLNSPISILHQKRLNHNLMYTVDHTFCYRSTKFICACAKSSADAHGTKIRDGNLMDDVLQKTVITHIVVMIFLG